MSGVLHNGNDNDNYNINRYGLGNIKMMENIVSIGLTSICGVLALYSFIRSQNG